MHTETHITAGHEAAAGARRRASSLASCASTTLAPYAPVVHQAPEGHTSHPTTWITGAAGVQATFMAFDGKNRPTRPLSERSP